MPLTKVHSTLRKALPKIDNDAWTGERPKQLHSIIAKLQRETIRLSQMEDIGGVRVVLPSLSSVDRTAQLITERFEVKGDDNYVVTPKPDTGYRARHIIVLEDELRIEIQLRTQLQNLWADMVERYTVLGIADLKHGQGSKEVLEFFFELSELLSSLEPQDVTAARLNLAKLGEIEELLDLSAPHREELVKQKKGLFDQIRSKLE